MLYHMCVWQKKTNNNNVLGTNKVYNVSHLLISKTWAYLVLLVSEGISLYSLLPFCEQQKL